MTFEDLIQRMEEKGLPTGGVQYRYEHFVETVREKDSLIDNPALAQKWLFAHEDCNKAFEHLNGFLSCAKLFGFITEDEDKSIFENLQEMR